MRFLAPLDTTGYTGKRQWCGPAALALLAAIPLRDAHATLVSVANQTRADRPTYRDLSGVYVDEMAFALRRHGLAMDPLDMHGLFPDVTQGPSLRRFAGTVVSPHHLLIEVEGHFLVGHLTARFRILADNWTKRPVDYTLFPKTKGRRVLNAWAVRSL